MYACNAVHDACFFGIHCIHIAVTKAHAACRRPKSFVRRCTYSCHGSCHGLVSWFVSGCVSTSAWFDHIYIPLPLSCKEFVSCLGSEVPSVLNARLSRSPRPVHPPWWRRTSRNSPTKPAVLRTRLAVRAQRCSLSRFFSVRMWIPLKCKASIPVFQRRASIAEISSEKTAVNTGKITRRIRRRRPKNAERVSAMVAVAHRLARGVTKGVLTW